MKCALLVVCALVATAAASGVIDRNADLTFEQFKGMYGRTYATKDEDAARRKAFDASIATIKAMRARNPHATFGVTPHADMTPAEFLQQRAAPKRFEQVAKDVARDEKKPAAVGATALGASPNEINWVTRGAVTGVKDQGLGCDCCWAFSTTGNIEGQWALANHTLTSASEQQFISCDTTNNFGVGAGLMGPAMKWLIDSNGGNAIKASVYPFTSGSGNLPACRSDLNVPENFAAKGIKSVKLVAGGEHDMAQWVGSNGPLSVAVDATCWQHYTGGIMTDCDSTSINHGVLIVGYDLTNSPPYWRLKNSWGSAWGESGYIRMGFGDDLCLVTTYKVSVSMESNKTSPDHVTEIIIGACVALTVLFVAAFICQRHQRRKNELKMQYMSMNQQGYPVVQ